jgi:translation initiation factor 2 gamma subunit (eIF-2gamma)
VLLISEEKPNPDYSINVSPPIPSKTDVISQVPSPGDDSLIIVILVGTAIIGALVMVLALANRRKRKKTDKKK